MFGLCCASYGFCPRNLMRKIIPILFFLCACPVSAPRAVCAGLVSKAYKLSPTFKDIGLGEVS